MAKKEKRDTPKVHEKLEGFDIKINPQGEIETTHTIDEINQFLNKQVVDKKLKDREDLDVRRADEEEED
jgi:hypothetical protein